jgi:hypothetical protein
MLLYSTFTGSLIRLAQLCKHTCVNLPRQRVATSYPWPFLRTDNTTPLSRLNHSNEQLTDSTAALTLAAAAMSAAAILVRIC